MVDRGRQQAEIESQRTLRDHPEINKNSKQMMESDKNAFYSNLKVEDRLRLYGIQLSANLKEASTDAYTS